MFTYITDKTGRVLSSVDNALFSLLPVQNAKESTDLPIKMSKNSVLQNFDARIEKAVLYFSQQNRKLKFEILAMTFAVASLVIAALQNSSVLLLSVDLIAAALSILVIFIV